MESKGVSESKKILLDTLSSLHEKGVDSAEILDLVQGKLKATVREDVKIPISVFRNSELGSLETIVKYMRENLLLTFRQIGELTGRNPVALAVTFRNAHKKHEQNFAEEIAPYHIPVSILKDRKLSVLENIAVYLKDTIGLTYHSIALLLNRDDRTIWTVYQRGRKKRK